MIYVVIAQTVVIAACLFVIQFLVTQASTERQELEDRLMAICHPMAQTQVSAERSPVDSTVSYVGEENYSALLKDPHATTKT
jgi:sensor histidine kinase regulating citrate/malate metabolism